jgi:hypothetical protein
LLISCGRRKSVGAKACQATRTAHIRPMADPETEQPLMLPFADKEGTGWHVIVRYHEGHERRIDGFATEQEALEWIIANSGEVDK